mgnify:CR=1 FL=1
MSRAETHPEQITRLMRGDGSATSRAPYAGLPGMNSSELNSRAGEPTHLLTQQEDGRWRASVLCPHCGGMDGRTGSLAECQALIDRHQFHVANCRGRRSA